MNDILGMTRLWLSGWSQWSVLLRKSVFFGRVEARNTSILVNHNNFFFWMVCTWTGQCIQVKSFAFHRFV